MIEIKLLALIVIANGAPVLMTKLLGARFATPVDFNRTFVDDRPLLGPAKTIRGIASSMLVTTLAAPMLGMSLLIGMMVASTAMCGDLLASFIKRRLGLSSSSMALGLDQIPESLLPMLACSPLLDLTWRDIIVVVLSFFVLELVLSRLLYKFHIRATRY
jgi:CDP-diglyceride synthetase